MRAARTDLNELTTVGMNAIRELESSDGILASGRNEAYGCVFGRDSLITALSLLKVYERTHNTYFLELVEKILRTLSNLQGRYRNIESGEEPGKIIHEYRPEKHEHLTQLREDPWFVYPEGILRNYDSVDATPLFLIAVHKFLEHKQTQEFVPSTRAALEWLMSFDGLLTYEFHRERRHGGLRVQSWMDSSESLFYEEDDSTPPYPIAPVEVQAYAWQALALWGEEARAEHLKNIFNQLFVLKGLRSVTLAFALDGNGRPLTAPRSSMGHVLWASAHGRSILDEQYIEPVRRRLLSRDLFVPSAGIRTLSNRSLRYDPHSYHNGSIWPHDTAILAEGLDNFGYSEDARRVRRALIRAWSHFKTPIELFAYERGLREYAPKSGHRACRVQAWSAASLLSTVASVE